MRYYAFFLVRLFMGTKSVRLTTDLVDQAKVNAKMHKRSVKEQIEHWVRIGKSIESRISLTDAYCISQGLLGLQAVPIKNVIVESNVVLDELESDRRCGFADKPVTDAPYFFEASIQQPGFLDKVDTATGDRQTGIFKNGVFQAFNI